MTWCTYTYAASLFLDPASGTVYLQNCYQPFTVKMDLQGTQTTAVDTKLFLDPAFSFNPVTGYVVYTTGNFAYISDFPFATGISQTAPAREYMYVNTYQHTPLTGNNKNIVTLYLQAEIVATTGGIDFYFVPGEATEDSTISS